MSLGLNWCLFSHFETESGRGKKERQDTRSGGTREPIKAASGNKDAPQDALNKRRPAIPYLSRRHITADIGLTVLSGQARPLDRADCNIPRALKAAQAELQISSVCREAIGWPISGSQSSHCWASIRCNHSYPFQGLYWLRGQIILARPWQEIKTTCQWLV